MTEKELFIKNLTLGTEFDKYVIEHPEFAEQIPDNAQIVLLPEYDLELCRINLKLSKTQKEKGQASILVKIQKLAPEPKSRLIEPRLELATV